MGHLGAKDLFNGLAKKVDGLHVRAPLNGHLYAILKELFSEAEADIFIRMPYTFSDIKQIRKATLMEDTKLRNLLEEMCMKGLVIDIESRGVQYFMPCPMVVGLFEWVMMKRAASGDDVKKLAGLFYHYFEGGDFYKVNTRHGQHVSIGRALAHEETLEDEARTLVLDYDSADAIIRSAPNISAGVCSCRHEKDHLGIRECDTPTDTCLNLGWTADYVIRRGMGKKISTAAALENIARSKELGLTITADNVKRNVTFICQCCGCCCHPLQGISRFGCANTIVTSNYMAASDAATCTGCGLCAKACPIHAVALVEAVGTANKNAKIARIDETICLGCGVCALKCPTKAMRLRPREKRVLLPETTFERIILQCIGLGTLQNQIFDDPTSLTQEFMRGFIGGFLKLPLKNKALMSAALQSRFFRWGFLKTAKAGMRAKGKAWVTGI